MEASVVVCLPIWPLRPCQPERSLKFHKAECERQRAVRYAVCMFPPVVEDVQTNFAVPGNFLQSFIPHFCLGV